MSHQYVYDKPILVSRLIDDMSSMAQEKTQRYSQRAYGVGLLVIGYDDHGPQLFETCPSGNYFEYHAISIGGRSQSAKTYLEKHFESFKDCDEKALVTHAVNALANCLGNDGELTTKNCAVSVVGKNRNYHEYTEEQLAPIIAARGAEAPMEVES